MYLDEQMTAKDPINLILVPAAFPVCLPEDIPTTCSTVSFNFILSSEGVSGGFAMYDTFKIERIYNRCPIEVSWVAR